jgi:phosphopantothenoylcysteine decarboxylase/phosphopantothenate--cysteine ligase
MPECEPSPLRVLITAGPTHEPVDRVRYLANRSSGRMGIALAERAVAREWPTTLLLGPTPLMPRESTFLGVDRFQSTDELDEALHRLWPAHDVLIMAAAVADYRPVSSGAVEKLERRGERLTLELEPTPDLLASLASTTRPDQITVGFALEPADRLARSAAAKLQRKRVDAIVANPLETIDSATISAQLVLRTGESLAAPPELTKLAFADWLLDRIEELRSSEPLQRETRTDATRPESP